MPSGCNGITNTWCQAGYFLLAPSNSVKKLDKALMLSVLSFSDDRNRVMITDLRTTAGLLLSPTAVMGR